MKSAIVEQTIQNIDTLLDPIELILRGKKPEQYPKALRDQMERMSAADLLIETVDSYLVRADETPSAALNAAKGMTAINPIPSVLRHRCEHIKAVAHPQSIFNFKVLGMDPYYRLLSQDGAFDLGDPVDISQDADAAILTRSDLHGLRQFLHLLRAKLSRDLRTINTRLIVQSTHNDFWGPVLEHLEIGRLSPAMMDGMDLHITRYPGALHVESPESTIQALKGMGLRAYRKPAPSKLNAEIQPGDLLYVCSGSPHKPIEIDIIFKAMQALVDVKPLSSGIVTRPREADETANSLEGNNWQKREETQKRIRAESQECFKALCAGRDPQNVWLIWDDRAREFKDQRLIRETKAFRHLLPVMNPYPYKMVPGTELARVLKNTSNYHMYGKLVPEAVREIETRTSAATPDTTIIDTACYVMARLDWMLQDNMPYIATFAKTHSRTLSEPRPYVPDINESEYYSAPIAFNDTGIAYDHLRSKMEIPNYLTTGSEMFLAMRTMGTLTGIDKHRAKIPSEFRLNADAGKLRLATQHIFFPGAKIADDVLAVIGASYEVMRDPDDLYDLGKFIRRQNTASLGVRCNDRHRDLVEKALSTMAGLYRDADAFLLTENTPELTRIPGIKWFNLVFDYSLKAGKQVDIRTIKSKFYGVLDEGHGTWTAAKQIFRHLNATPLIPNVYEHIVTECNDKAALRQALCDHRTRYVRPEIVRKSSTIKEGSVPVDPDLYRVTVYCSASLGDQTHAYGEADVFSRNLTAQSFAIINGGGREGVMYAISAGAHDYISEWKAHFGQSKAPPRFHVSSEQCYETYEREDGWHEKNHAGRIHEIIEQRMANLMNTDAEVLMAGGIGSIQEIGASILMREWGLVPTAHRPFIIINQRLDDRLVFDPLIAMFTPEDMKRLNVHIVSNEMQAMAILEQSRRNLRLVLGRDAIYIPTHDFILPKPANKFEQPRYAHA